MSAQELFAETGIDVSGSDANHVELSDESDMGADDMLEYAVQNRSALQ
jgi:hypothetical protein